MNKDRGPYIKVKKEEWTKPENLQKIEEWAKLGLIMENVAHNMGIAVSTFYLWKKEYQEIEEAWLRGKLHADSIVVNSLFKSATGYQTVEVVKEKNEFGELEVTKQIFKEVAPNVTAIDKWLKNRMPDAFKDNQLTDMYREKVRMETERIRLENEKTKLEIEIMQGLSTDTNGIAMLEKMFKGEK